MGPERASRARARARAKVDEEDELRLAVGSLSRFQETATLTKTFCVALRSRGTTMRDVLTCARASQRV